MTRPRRPLAALLLAAALAAPATWPAPALADLTRDEERARTLGLGLAALAAVALAVRAADRAAERREEEEKARAERSLGGAGRGERPDPGRVLPAVCLRALPGDARDPLLGLDCLGRRAGDAAALLPLACVVTRPRGAGIETGFDPGCLAREGWRTG